MNIGIVIAIVVVTFLLGYGVGWRVGSESVFRHIKVMFEEIDNDVLEEYKEELNREGTD